MNIEVEKYLYNCKYPNSTNYISSIADLVERINEKSIEVVCSEPLILIESFDLFRKMYCFLADGLDKIDWGALNEPLERFNELYAEIVLKDRNNEVLRAFEKLGFTEYRVYLRKNLINPGKK